MSAILNALLFGAAIVAFVYSIFFVIIIIETIAELTFNSPILYFLVIILRLFFSIFHFDFKRILLY